MAILSTGFEQQFDDGIRNLNAMDDFDPEYIVSQGSDGTMGQIRPYQIQTEQRVGVNDSNIALSGNGNKLVAYTAITADRTVTLPSTPVANQRIWVTDESGLCSNARRIIVAPGAGNTIGGDSFAALTFPNGSGYFEFDGVNKWNIISTTSIQFSSGVNTMPTVTDNGNGTVTLGTGVYSLFANTNGTGRPKAYQIAGGTFTFVDNSTNFIYAEYNTTTGTVSLQQTTAESTLNDLTQILIYGAYRQGTTLHPRNFDTWGVALSNKLNRSIYRTQRIRFEEGGVQVGESATPAVRTITISGGTVWIAAAENVLIGLTSAANTCYHVIQTAPGVWNTTTTVTQYNNTQYNTTAGLQTLSNNNYAVNWVYRSVGTDNDMAIVLGSGDYNLGAAQASSKPTNLPTFMQHMELIGRIIVQKNANTATQIDNVSSTFFSSAGITDHNALNNLQGGIANERYHLTLAQYNSAIAPTLQNAYNNSVQPQVLVSDSPGAIIWQSARALNTTTLVEWKNIAGTTTASITGAGRFTSSVDASISGFTVGRGNSGLTNNTAFGSLVLTSNIVGTNNSAFGVSAAQLTTGSHNTAIGGQSQTANSSANNNTSVGSGALFGVTGSSNTGIGTNSMSSLTSGTNNTAIGNLAGNSLNDKTTGITTPTNSCFIGYRTSSLSNGSTNENVFGYDTSGNGSNTVTLGNDSVVSTFLKGKVINNNTVRLKGYTVATLPTGTVGDIAFVTDALTPTWNAAAVGGGAVITTVFYNGTTWITN